MSTLLKPISLPDVKGYNGKAPSLLVNSSMLTSPRLEELSLVSVALELFMESSTPITLKHTWDVHWTNTPSWMWDLAIGLLMSPSLGEIPVWDWTVDIEVVKLWCKLCYQNWSHDGNPDTHKAKTEDSTSSRIFTTLVMEYVFQQCRMLLLPHISQSNVSVTLMMLFP